jgi:hypothetical protein
MKKLSELDLGLILIGVLVLFGIGVIISVIITPSKPHELSHREQYCDRKYQDDLDNYMCKENSYICM